MDKSPASDMFCKYFFVYVACFHSLTSVFHRTAISGLGAGREGWRSRTSWDRLPGPVKPSGDSVLAEAAETVLQKGNGGRGARFVPDSQPRDEALRLYTLSALTAPPRAPVIHALNPDASPPEPRGRRGAVSRLRLPPGAVRFPPPSGRPPRRVLPRPWYPLWGQWS